MLCMKLTLIKKVVILMMGKTVQTTQRTSHPQHSQVAEWSVVSMLVVDAVKVMYVLVTHNNIKPELTGRVAGSNPVLTTRSETRQRIVCPTR